MGQTYIDSNVPEERTRLRSGAAGSSGLGMLTGGPSVTGGPGVGARPAGDAGDGRVTSACIRAANASLQRSALARSELHRLQAANTGTSYA